MSKGHYIIPIFVAHEGCPHNCVFCNQNTITGNDQRVDGEFTRETIEQYLKSINRQGKGVVVEVSFFGGTFTAIDIERQKELLAVAKEYKDKGFIDYIHMSTRPDYINDEILTNLKNYSADIIELGVQSLDEEVLFKAGRGHSVEDVERASKLIKNYGFTLGHQIMLGLPGDTPKKDIESVKKSITMKPDIYRIYPALVIKDTPMERMYNNGLYKPYSLYEAVETSKKIYSMLLANNIKVIRVGLQPTEEINEGGELVTGPFHPAFRELVEGSIYNDMILSNIDKQNKDSVILTINAKDLSKLYADKKKFFIDMKKQLKTKNVKVIQDPMLERGRIILEQSSKKKIMSIYKYISKMYAEGNLEII